MSRNMSRAAVIALVLASPVLAQEGGRILPLEFRILDLTTRTLGAEGAIEAMRVQETATEVRIDLAADVMFDFDQAVILPAAEETLGRAAGIIRERGGSQVRIEGHTDAKGDDAYNQRLSRARAEAVRAWLAGLGGVSGVQYDVKGLGETRPIAPNAKADGSDDPEGRRKNRRVELVVRKR